MCLAPIGVLQVEIVNQSLQKLCESASVIWTVHETVEQISVAENCEKEMKVLRKGLDNSSIIPVTSCLEGVAAVLSRAKRTLVEFHDDFILVAAANEFERKSLPQHPVSYCIHVSQLWLHSPPCQLQVISDYFSQPLLGDAYSVSIYQFLLNFAYVDRANS